MAAINSMSSVLGASVTVVGSTVGITAVASSSQLGLYIKVIAAVSYLLLLSVVVSFVIKKSAIKRAKRR